MAKIDCYLAMLFIINVCIPFSVFCMEKDIIKIEEQQNQITIHDMLISEEVLTIFAHSFKEEDKKKRIAKIKQDCEELKSELGENADIKNKDMVSICCFLDDTHQKLLKDAIKFFMTLRCICKKFNTILMLQKIGSLLCYRDQYSKNYVLNNLVTSNNEKYPKRRAPISILLYAGADAFCFKNELFHTAVEKNDIELTKFIFKLCEKIKNQEEKRKKLGPIFGYVRTVEIAQLFLDNNCFDVYWDCACLPNGDPNYLWKMLDKEYPLELMEFCVKHGMDPRKLSSWTKECLLHSFAHLTYCYWMINDDIENYLKKAEYILKLIPDMINALNICGKTSLDVAENELKELQKHCKSNTDKIIINISLLEKLIELFKQHQCVISNELAQ